MIISSQFCFDYKLFAILADERLIKPTLISTVLMCLISKFRINKVTIELHLLSSLFNIGQHSPGLPRFLVNSGNEYLLGASLPYFPRGGLPAPAASNVYGDFQSWQTSGGWGGLSAGPGMVYPVQSIDGEVRRAVVDPPAPVYLHL